MTLNDIEHDIIGTMSVVTFTGFIEDYLKKLKKMIHKNLVHKSKNNLPLRFNKRFKNALLTRKVDILLEGMGVKDLVFGELKRLQNWNFVTDYDKFRDLRNKIAHDDYYKY